MPFGLCATPFFNERDIRFIDATGGILIIMLALMPGMRKYYAKLYELPTLTGQAHL